MLHNNSTDDTIMQETEVTIIKQVLLTRRQTKLINKAPISYLAYLLFNLYFRLKPSSQDTKHNLLLVCK